MMKKDTYLALPKVGVIGRFVVAAICILALVIARLLLGPLDMKEFHTFFVV